MSATLHPGNHAYQDVTLPANGHHYVLYIAGPPTITPDGNPRKYHQPQRQKHEHPAPRPILGPCKGDWMQRGCASGKPSVHHVTTHDTPRDCCAYHSPYDVTPDKPVGWSDEGYYPRPRSLTSATSTDAALGGWTSGGCS